MDSISILKVLIIACSFAYCYTQTNVVGRSLNQLDGNITICRARECNLANLVVDAMIDYNARQYKGKGSWTDVAIAILNSGSLAASINRSPTNDITEADVQKALPYKDKIVKMELKGGNIRSMLEWSATYSDENNLCMFRNAFLHFAGLMVDYNLTAEIGSRVNAVLVRCTACPIADYEPLKNDDIYSVLTTDYIANGGDGYKMISNIKNTPMNITVDKAVIEYLKHHSPVHPEIRRTITFLGASTSKQMENCIKEKSRSLPTVITKVNSGNSEVYGIISIIIPSIVVFAMSM